MLLALKTMQDSLASYRKTLRESEERTRFILDSSGEGIYGVNTAGECIFCNPAGLSMLGYSKVSDVLHRDMHALMHHTYPEGSPYSVEDCKASVTRRRMASSSPARSRIHWLPTLEVMITTVFLKSTVQPWPSVNRPSSSTCNNTLNTS